MGKAEIEAFLMSLVGKRNISSLTHRQALSALLFLYARCWALIFVVGGNWQNT